jgi:hypothetical protein
MAWARTPEPRLEGTCRSCGAPVWWLEHTTTGKRSPVDPEPHPAGNIVREGALNTKYRVLHAGEEPAEGEPRYRAHWVTCPMAARHRRAS